MTQEVSLHSLSLQSGCFGDGERSFRLLDVDDESLHRSLLNSRKRQRSPEAASASGQSGDQPSLARCSLKATRDAAAITTDEGKTFGLRKVSYSNALLLTRQSAPEDASTTAAAAPSTSLWTAVALQDGIFECPRQGPRLDALTRYLSDTTLSLDELQGHAPYTGGAPLLTWHDVRRLVCASDKEIRDALAERRAVSFGGYIRRFGWEDLDNCCVAIVAQLDALIAPPTAADGDEQRRTCKRADLCSLVAFPELLVAASLSLLGAKFGTVAGEATVEFSVAGLVRETGRMALRRIARRASSDAESISLRELRSEWRRSLPLLAFGTELDPAALQGWILSSVPPQPDDTARFCDAKMLSTDPRQRLKELFAIQPRILGVELRLMLLPLFPQAVGGRSAELDSLVGRACRDHKSKAGQFFSLE